MDAFETDPRVEGLLFMSSMNPLLFILACYAGIIHYGPQWMANRKAFNIRYLVLVYDITVAFLHLYLFFKLLKAVIRLQYNWVCEPVHYNGVSDDEMAIVTNIHLFFICKLLELLDTVFFVLRRRKDQLIAAHYYHHVAMVMFSYIGVRCTPGGSLFFIPLINSFIHFTVYVNHSLTLIQSKYKTSSWWRKYVFVSMTVQVLFCFVHCLLAIIVGCETGKYFNYYAVGNMMTMIILNFMQMNKGGFSLRIADILRYSSKVNND